MQWTPAQPAAPDAEPRGDDAVAPSVESSSQPEVAPEAPVAAHPAPEERASAFECNICFCDPTDPVVTTCGHVHCWPCIYKWIETFRDKTTPPVCPVCKVLSCSVVVFFCNFLTPGLTKNVIDSSKCIPIYGRGGAPRDPRQTVPVDPTEADAADHVPQRPGPAPREEAPQVSAPLLGAGGPCQALTSFQRHPVFGWPMGGQAQMGAWGVNFSAGFGFPGGGAFAFGGQHFPPIPAANLTPEQRQMQRQLSQVLLLCFIIFC